MSYLGLLDHRGRPLFKKSHLSAVEDAGTWMGGPDTFGDHEARRFRYALYKALWENNAYDPKMHSWATARNAASGLYRYTRGTNSPVYRLVEVFATHIFNGRLDMKAGDGKATPSAIPIDTENDAIRRPIARLWRDSNWAVNKAILCRTGTVCGDVAVALHDNVRKRRVELEVLDPGGFPYIGRDHQGNVTGYIRQEYRPNPLYNPAKRDAVARAGDPEATLRDRPYALYTEYCWREADTVIFQTFIGEGQDRRGFNWRGQDEDGRELPWDWDVDYGFVPLAVIPHLQSWSNQQYGFSEIHALLVKVDEVCDLGSKLHDQIRKVVEGMWFFAGVDHRQRRDLVVERPAATADNPQPGRQEMPTIYAGMGATATPLVIPIDISSTSNEIMNQRDEIEQDNPVLRYDRARKQVSGDASAKALREIRKPAEGVIQERRANYDSLMARVHMMAISMGSMRGYPEYEGFNPDSYESGELDHAIGYRSVYGVDPVDEAELDQIRASAAATWKGAGVPIRLVLEDMGWDEEKLAAFDREANAEQQKALDQQEAMIALQPKPAAPAPGKSSSSAASNGRPKSVSSAN